MYDEPNAEGDETDYYAGVTLNSYLEELKRKKLSLLIYRNGELIFSNAGKGVKPLLDAIDLFGRNELRGTIVADKIVGKAAALLITYITAAEVHAAVLSISAKKIFHTYDVKFYYSEDVTTIRGQNSKDVCPFEKLVQTIDNPEEAYERIKSRIEREEEKLMDVSR